MEITCLGMIYHIPKDSRSVDDQHPKKVIYNCLFGRVKFVQHARTCICTDIRKYVTGGGGDVKYTEWVIIWADFWKVYNYLSSKHKNYGIYNLPDNYDEQWTYSGLAGREAFSPTDKDRKPVVRKVVLTMIICFLSLWSSVFSSSHCTFSPCWSQTPALPLRSTRCSLRMDTFSLSTGRLYKEL